jgi:hypothetical protein
MSDKLVVIRTKKSDRYSQGVKGKVLVLKTKTDGYDKVIAIKKPKTKVEYNHCNCCCSHRECAAYGLWGHTAAEPESGRITTYDEFMGLGTCLWGPGHDTLPNKLNVAYSDTETARNLFRNEYNVGGSLPCTGELTREHGGYWDRSSTTECSHLHIEYVYQGRGYYGNTYWFGANLKVTCGWVLMQSVGSGFVWSHKAGSYTDGPEGKYYHYNIPKQDDGTHIAEVT